MSMPYEFDGIRLYGHATCPNMQEPEIDIDNAPLMVDYILSKPPDPQNNAPFSGDFSLYDLYSVLQNK